MPNGFFELHGHEAKGIDRACVFYSRVIHLARTHILHHRYIVAGSQHEQSADQGRKAQLRHLTAENHTHFLTRPHLRDLAV